MQIQEKIFELAQFLKSKGFTSATIQTYSSILEQSLSHLGIKFTEAQVEEYLTYRSLAPRTYNLYRSVLKFYAEKELGFTIKFSMAKPDKFMPVYVTREELIRVLLTIPNVKHRLWYTLMYRSGLRISEVAKCKKHHFYLDNMTMLVRGKGRKDRITILHPKTIKTLRHYFTKIQNSNPYVFQSGNGHISTRSIQERLKQAISDSKITKEFTCHDLRHTFAVNFLDNTNDIETLRKLLGHSKLSTTQEYLKCRTTNLTEVAIKLYGKPV